jgi:hypothetical protein
MKIQQRNKVFVSKHNQSLHISKGQIIDFCSRHFGYGETNDSQQHLKITPTHVIIKECPFCSKPTHGKVDNLFKLYILIGGGAYMCHRCGAKGSWFDFTQKTGSFEVDNCSGDLWNHGHSNTTKFNAIDGQSHHSTRSLDPHNSKTACLPLPSPTAHKIFMSNLLNPIPSNDIQHHTRDYTSSRDQELALRYLMNERGFTRKTLRFYGVGLTMQKFPSEGGQYVKAACITFPWMMRANDVKNQEALRGAEFSWDGAEDKLKSRITPLPPTDDPRTSGQMASYDSIMDGVTDMNSSADNNIMDSPCGTVPETSATDSASSVTKSDSEDANGPWVSRRIKLRAIENKAWQRLDPPGGGWSLFGLNTGKLFLLISS